MAKGEQFFAFYSPRFAHSAGTVKSCFALNWHLFLNQRFTFQDLM
jgi:hypothetical protein